MARRSTLEDFISAARATHGDRYDYSESEYVSSNKPLTIICREHGRFNQTPSNHTRGKGCAKCAGVGALSQEDFLTRAVAAHGDKYDYSLVEYKKNSVPVKIVCPEHGVFEQIPAAHMKGKGCAKCAGVKKLTHEEFVARAAEIHEGKYDYSKAVYTLMLNKVTVTCKQHGDFEVTAGNHLSGKGCQVCAGNKPMTTEEFVAKARKIHGDKYDYSKTVYVRSAEAVTITCSVHGDFEQRPNNHLNGHGCFACNQIGVPAMESLEFIRRATLAHEGRYWYDYVDYVRSDLHVKIQCEKHGIFEQMPEKHLAGQGCPKCAFSGPSKAQTNISEFIAQYTPVVDEWPVPGSNYRMDMYLPEKNIGVEYHGLIWHSTMRISEPLKDYKKHKVAEALGIRVIHIYEDEWAYNSQTVRRTLLSALGLLPRAYARNLNIVSVTNDDARVFYDKFHLQGGRQVALSYGLEDDAGELIACMSFDILRSERTNKSKRNYELVRYAASRTVVGGPSRLLARFIKDDLADRITSYSDSRVFSGVMYEKLGFTLTHETRPDYFYTTGRLQFGRKHKSGYQKKHLKKMFPDADHSQTEWKICEDNGLYRIYDCGKKRWDFTVNPNC